MKQIHEKIYPEPYRASGKIIQGIGVNFVSKDKEIKGWDVVVL